MIQFHTKEGGWVYFAIFGMRPFAWLMHGGWACLSFTWLYRFTAGVRIERMRYRNRGTFYDFQIAPGLYWRNKYCRPAGKWYASFGRICIRKWWVVGPELAT